MIEHRSSLITTVLAAAVTLVGSAQAAGNTSFDRQGRAISADGALVTSNTSNDQSKERGELAYKIVMKWGAHVQEAYAIPVQGWAQEMIPLFRKATLASMQQAASAKTFDAMSRTLLQNNGSVPVLNPKTLGEATNDLVFVPITPCRIIDTRLAGGAIPANTVRSYDVTSVSNYSFQGGDATNCSGAGAAGSFAAAAVNFTVVSPAFTGGNNGFITAFPFLETQPLTASVNFSSSDVVRGNSGIVRLDQGASANELSIYSTTQTHVVADLYGYFINPVLAPLDCEEKADPGLTILAGASGTDISPDCTVGYKVISGGCVSNTFDGRIVSSRTRTGTNTHFCAFRNEGTGSMVATTYSICCKLPSGR